MKDFLGNEIHVGDTVVYAYSWRSGYEFAKGVVTKLTPKMVKIKSDKPNKHDTIRMPHVVVVIK